MAFKFDDNEDPELEAKEPEITNAGDGGDVADSREVQYDNAEAEGVEDAVIDDLAAKDDITLDDLRTIPGADRMTDEQLEAAWEEAKKAAGIEGAGSDPKQIELPFPVYDAEGNKVTKDKVTLEGLISGSLQIGYQAMGKEQKKGFADLIRNASQGHFNEHRYTTVQSQLTEAIRERASLSKQVSEHAARETQWNAALTSLIAGEKGPMERLVNEYRKALTSTGITPEGFISKDQVAQEREVEQRGQEYYQTVLMPEAYKLAGEMGANPKEVLGAIEFYIKNEPMLTRERIQEILQYDVPMAFERNGYSRKVGGSVSGGQENETEKLRKELDEVRKSLAEQSNKGVANVRAKQGKLPPAGGGSTAGAGESMPSFKSRSQFKAWSQGDPDWQKS